MDLVEEITNNTPGGIVRHDSIKRHEMPQNDLMNSLQVQIPKVISSTSAPTSSSLPRVKVTKECVEKESVI